MVPVVAWAERLEGFVRTNGTASASSNPPRRRELEGMRELRWPENMGGGTVTTGHGRSAVRIASGAESSQATLRRNDQPRSCSVPVNSGQIAVCIHVPTTTRRRKLH